MSRAGTTLRNGLLAGGVVVALHLGVTAVRAVGGDAGRPAVSARSAILPAAQGQVRVLALQFHRVAAERFLPVFGQMLRALDPTARVEVIVADDQDAALFRKAYARWFPDGGGPAVGFAKTGKPITSWLRDRLAVCGPIDTAGADARPTLIAPAAAHAGPATRTHDWLVPWALGTRTGGFTERARYRFDGGDLIADAARAFVATPLFARNPDVDPDLLAGMLAADVGRPLVRIGATGAVPDHHIGMFVTPLGDGRVAVGDPDLALDALRAAGALPADGWLTVGAQPLELDLRPERLDRFRRVASELRDAGYTVVPIPILPATDDFVFLSYNNVLADRRPDGLHVLMPRYGVDALDTAATSAWEALGATVHPIDCAGIFRLGGTVRCLCAPLARG